MPHDLPYNPAPSVWVRFSLIPFSEVRDSFLIGNIQIGPWAHPASYATGGGGFPPPPPPGIMRLGRQVDHNLHVTTPVKNEWNCTFTRPILLIVCLHGVDMENLIFYLSQQTKSKLYRPKNEKHLMNRFKFLNAITVL